MRREQEEAPIKGYHELLTASPPAAYRGHLACVWGWRVFWGRRHGGSENTFGSFEKTCSVLLRLPDARGRNLEDPRYEVSEV